ncbi:hypothetical protein [Chlorogloeopsis fritschii]|uniref:hypothetical protein n=1 Tax=Chlorogloeopsis fritschii TaxID=1124 RepID=UPI00370D0B47
MINKLAKVISAATVLAMTTTLVPQSALGLGKFSGGSVDSSETLEFGILTYEFSCERKFRGAIQTPVLIDDDDFNSNTPPKYYNFKPGTLEVSVIDEIDKPDLFQSLKNQAQGTSFEGKFSGKAVQYESTLEDSSNPQNFMKFKFYAPYIYPFTNIYSLSVFNTSNLTTFLNNQGKVLFPKQISPVSQNIDTLNLLNDNIFTSFSFTPNPENKRFPLTQQEIEQLREHCER